MIYSNISYETSSTTYTSIIIRVHDGEHSISHKRQTVGADQTQRLFVLLERHLRVDRLALEALCELVDLIIA